MTSSLMYITTSRLDIVFSVCLCARFQSDPRESHLVVVKRIFRYLKGIDSLALWYPKGYSISLLGYTDADYDGFFVDRKSTSGMAQFLGACLVSWVLNKQNNVSLSTTKAEYVATTTCCSQLLWLKRQLRYFGMTSGSVHILCDNTSAINMSKESCASF
ncbi:uncharacterized protein [Phyllobates terribilis]|uniref:uncharacterized protein n=1 Tax=Phyllobates terribilis TaxID=111132 RepID=UPI003CCB4886